MSCYSTSYKGLNVLYITLEMSEERIGNKEELTFLFDVTIDDLHDILKQLYNNKVQKIQSKTHGKLIIKEYLTASITQVIFVH